uniref:hypothetical protein n=1 Tax=Pseudonocardia sp. D17 TaxID=882661 RepID=UPI0030D4B502
MGNAAPSPTMVRIFRAVGEPETGHRGQDPGKRVGLQEGLELGGKGVSLDTDLAQLGGDPGDHSAERGGARDDDGLRVERGQDRGRECRGQTWGTRAHGRGDPGLAEVAKGLRGRGGNEQIEHPAAVHPRPEQAFQGRVDVEQGIAQPVGQPCRLGGEVVVVAGQHGELGEGLVIGADPAQGVGHGAGGPTNLCG